MGLGGVQPWAPEEAPSFPASRSHNTFIPSSQPVGDKITIHLENEINSFRLNGDPGEKYVGCGLAAGRPADSWPCWFRRPVGEPPQPGGGSRAPSESGSWAPGESCSSLMQPFSSDEACLSICTGTSSEPLACLCSAASSFSGGHATVSCTFRAA